MSARGFGGIVRSAAQPPPAAPATVTGADNGLSLSGTDVVLGGILINDTDIDINASHLYINEGILRLIELDPGAGRYLFGKLDTGTNNTNAISFENDTAIIYAGTLGEALKVTQSITQYEFGALLGVGNGLRLEIDDGAIRAQLYSNVGRLFSLDQTTGEYQFGDSDIVGNGNAILIDDAANTTNIMNGGTSRLSLDSTADIYAIGDINAAINGCQFEIQDSANLFSMFNGIGQVAFEADITNGLYRIGDLQNIVNNNKFIIDDVNNLAYLQSGAGRKLNLDTGNNLYQIGDVDNQNSGAQISIDDFAGIINIQNVANNVGITINGTPGFTGNVVGPASITVDNGIVTNVT